MFLQICWRPGCRGPCPLSDATKTSLGGVTSRASHGLVTRMTPLARILSWPVHAYRAMFSPHVGHNCRFHPTCSAYALEALEKHGGIKGGWLALRRILRCNPLGGSGIDNVPD